MINREWMDDALCREVDPEIFFPEIGSNITPAREVCQACTVRLPCLEDALENNDAGIRGGLTQAERKKLRHIRRVTTPCERCGTDIRKGLHYCTDCRIIRKRETEQRYQKKKAS